MRWPRVFESLLTLGLATCSLIAQETPWPLPDPLYPVADPQRAVISGYVRYEKGGKSGENIAVKLERSSGSQVAIAWTGGSGRFEFFRIPRGPYFLVVNQVDYKPVRVPVEFSYVPIEGIIIDLAREEKENPTAAGDSVTVGQLQVPKKAQKEYEKGLRASSDKQPDESIRHFQKAIDIFPGYDDAYIQLALVHLQQGAPVQAQQVAAKAIAANEKNARAHALLGVAYREQKQPPDAVRALERSLTLEENSWFAHLELGRTLLRLNKLQEAYGHVVRAHELNAGVPSTHLELYKTLILRDDYRGALAELEEFLKLFPKHSLATRAREKREALQHFLVNQKP